VETTALITTTKLQQSSENTQREINHRISTISPPSQLLIYSPFQV